MFGVVVALAIHALLYGPQAALITEQFSPRLRYTGSSLAYTLAGVIGGAPAPLVLTALLAGFDSWWILGAYLALTAVLTGIGLVLARDPVVESEEDTTVAEGGAGMTVLDLNCDVAEGFGAWRIADDDALLTVVTGANIACGFHAGDPSAMRRACLGRGAARRGDRRARRLPRPRGLRPPVHRHRSRVADRRRALPAGRAVGVRRGGRRADRVREAARRAVRAIGSDDGQAGAVVEAVRQFDPALPVLGMPGSRWLALAAEAGLPTVPEAFADRAYLPDGRLVPRRAPGAVLTDPAAVASRVVRLVTTGELEAADGTMLAMRARSVCVHGDTPGAVDAGPGGPRGPARRGRGGAELRVRVLPVRGRGVAGGGR